MASKFFRDRGHEEDRFEFPVNGPATCGNEGCGAEVNRSDKVRHETELCKCRKTECFGCGKLKKQVEELKRNLEMAKKNAEEKQREMEEKQKDMDRKIAAMMKYHLKMKEAVEGASKEFACNIEEVFNDFQIDSSPPTQNAQSSKPRVFLSSQNLGPRIGYDVIIMGGCNIDDKVLNSVEMFSSKDGRWIDLPPMVIPRKFASSVVHKNQVIVSGGENVRDTFEKWKTEPIESIEILNLEKRPLKWEMSCAKLPCPLYGHQTFIYEGKLLVVSPKTISEISLSPPHKITKLYNSEELRFPYNANLVNDEIFVFCDDSQRVLVYNLLANVCRRMPCLPVRVSGMSTVVCDEKIILLGGRKKLNLSESVQNSGDVIMYDTETGESEMLPAMKHPRSFSSAILKDDVIVVMGGYYNSVEFYNFRANAWQALRAMKIARYDATAVVSPIPPH